MTEAMKQFPVKQLPSAAEKRRGCGVDWSDRDVGKLIRLRAARKSSIEIAAALNRTPLAVRLKLHRLGFITEPHRSSRRRRVAA